MEDCWKEWADQTRCILVQIGTKGSAGQSLSKAKGALGLTRITAVRNNMDAAEKYPEDREPMGTVDRPLDSALFRLLGQGCWWQDLKRSMASWNGIDDESKRIRGYYIDIQNKLIWLGYTCNIRSNEQQSLLSFVICSYMIPQAQTFMRTVGWKMESSQEFVQARLFRQQRWASVAHEPSLSCLVWSSANRSSSWWIEQCHQKDNMLPV